MSLGDTLSYFTALVAIAIAPGPVVLMLMVRAAGNDALGAAAFGLGFALGGVMIITAVCFGLAAWLTAVPEVFEYSKFLMMAYFVYLADGVWRGSFDMDSSSHAETKSVATSVAAGMVTCFISPYMMILFPLVLPEMLDIQSIQLPDFAIVSVVTFAALATGAGMIVVFTAQIRRIVNSAHATLIMNRTLAAILVGVGGWIAFG